MINGFEFARIKKSYLPESWQEEGVLSDLEMFLQDNWQQRSIFYTDGQIASKQQFVDFDVRDGIKLQNYIGTIVFKGEQLNIFPKIFKEDADDQDATELSLEELIDNLVYWLEYCDRLNFPFISMKGELNEAENLMELFITIYVNYVRAAIDRQRYYQYEDVIETGMYVKGKIDFGDYFTKKYPSGNRSVINYTYSNFVFDNSLNRIIKCTCIFLLGVTNQEANKATIRNILLRLGEVANINCNPYDCDKIHLSIMNSNYRIILSMSKMFLLNKVNTYNVGNTESFCFLFPAEVLFEGFISGFIKEVFSNEAKVKTQVSDQYLADLVVDNEMMGSVFRLQEDIVIEYEDAVLVLDTKYKEIERFEKVKTNRKLSISDNDMKQMAVYAVRRGAKRLFLVYPLHRGEPLEKLSIRYDIHIKEEGKDVVIPLEILKVPFAINESKPMATKMLTTILREKISGGN